ncbi:hypothetical protein [Hydrogenivirga sp.]
MDDRDRERFLLGDVRDKDKLTAKELERVLRRAHLLDLHIYGIDVMDSEGNVVDVLYWSEEDKFWYLSEGDDIAKRYPDKFFSITYGTEEDLISMMEEVEEIFPPPYADIDESF